jgi:hypothetical protein
MTSAVSPDGRGLLQAGRGREADTRREESTRRSHISAQGMNACESERRRQLVRKVATELFGASNIVVPSRTRVTTSSPEQAMNILYIIGVLVVIILVAGFLGVGV